MQNRNSSKRKSTSKVQKGKKEESGLTIQQKIGKQGETNLTNVLKEVQKYYGGYIIRNVYIHNKLNKPTTEIDAIYVHYTGLYIFEMKNYTGVIDNLTGNKNWVQYHDYHDKLTGRTYLKPYRQFYSPVLQNQNHVTMLIADLQMAGFPPQCASSMYSYVIFGREAHLRYKFATYGLKVLTLYELPQVFASDLRSRRYIYTEADCQRLVKHLKKCANISKAEREEHIRIANYMKYRNGG